MKTKLTMIMLIAGFLCAEAQEWNWSEDQLSYAREGLSATALDSSIFFSGGRLWDLSYKNTVDIYDVSENDWSTFTLESQDRSYTTAISCNAKVFIAGGINLSNLNNCPDVDIYDKNNEEWTIDSLSQGRHFIGAVANGNMVYFAGGLKYDGSFNYFDVIDIYDTENEAWSTMFLTEPKAGVGAATVGSKVFFAGGGSGPNTHTDLVEIYDVNTGEWTYDTLSQARSLPATVAYANKVYFAGGMLPNSFSSDVVDIYNVDTESWEVPQTLSEPRIARALKVKDALVFAGETDYISSGGYYGPANGVIDIYYPETDQWSDSIPDLNPARVKYGCAAYEDKAYFGGGYPGGSSLTDDVSILEYDYITGFFEDRSIHEGTQVYPNPFTTSIGINFNLQQSGKVNIIIYNNIGEQVDVVVNEYRQQGNQEVMFNAEKLKPGIYFCVLKTNNGIQTKKMIKL